MTSSAVSPAPPEAAGPLDAARSSECRVFCRYLLGMNPDPYIAGWYLRGHGGMPCSNGAPIDRFDQALVRVARQGPAWARVADAYARRFRPFGLLRQKLVLLLAILEHAPTTGARLTRGWAGGRFWFLLAIGATGAVSTAALLGGIILLGPLQLVMRGRPPRPGGPA